jgi:hypothetical protein
MANSTKHAAAAAVKRGPAKLMDDISFHQNTPVFIYARVEAEPLHNR